MAEGRLTWQNITAPDFTGVADILNGSASNWDKGLSTIAGAFRSARETQMKDRSAAMFPELAKVASEGQVDPLLNGLPGQIAARDMTPELQTALLNLRTTAMGFDSTRLSQAQTRQATSNAAAANGRASAAASREADKYSREVRQEEAWNKVAPLLLERAAASARGEDTLPAPAPDAGFSMGVPATSSTDTPAFDGYSTGAAAPKGASVYDLSDLARDNPDLSATQLLAAVASLQTMQNTGAKEVDRNTQEDLTNAKNQHEWDKVLADEQMAIEDQAAARGFLNGASSKEGALASLRDSDKTPAELARLIPLIEAGSGLEYTADVGVGFNADKAMKDRIAKMEADNYRARTDEGLTDPLVSTMVSLDQARTAQAAAPAAVPVVPTTGGDGASAGGAGGGGGSAAIAGAAGSLTQEGLASKGLMALPGISNTPEEQDVYFRKMSEKTGLPIDFIMERARRTASTAGPIHGPFTEWGKMYIDESALEDDLANVTPEMLDAAREKATLASGDKEDLGKVEESIKNLSAELAMANRKGSTVSEDRKAELQTALDSATQQRATFIEDRPARPSALARARTEEAQAAHEKQWRESVDKALTQADAEKEQRLLPQTKSNVAALLQSFGLGAPTVVDNSVGAQAERLAQGQPAVMQDLGLTGDFQQDSGTILEVLGQVLPVPVRNLAQMEPAEREKMLANVVKKIDKDPTIDPASKKKLFTGIWQMNQQINQRGRW